MTQITHAIHFTDLETGRSGLRTMFFAPGEEHVQGYSREEAEWLSGILTSERWVYVATPLWSRPVVTEVVVKPAPKPRKTRAPKRTFDVVPETKTRIEALEEQTCVKYGAQLWDNWPTQEGTTEIRIYKGEQVVAIAYRKRAYDAGPAWTLHSTAGSKLGTALTYRGARAKLLQQVIAQKDPAPCSTI